MSHGILLGRGTKVVREPATITEITEITPRASANPHDRTYRVEQTIRVQCTVMVTKVLDQNSEPSVAFYCCSLCKTSMPQPTAAVAEYLLTYHDGGRFVFPRHEDVEPERDQYPCVGWKEIDSKLMCPSCVAEFKQFIAGKKKKR